MSMTPADLSARLRELMEEATPLPCTIGARRDKTVWMSLGDQVKGPHYQGDFAGPFKDAVLFQYLRVNAPTIIRLLEAGEGVEKRLSELLVAVEFGGLRNLGSEEHPNMGFKAYIPDTFVDDAREALATLRAAREGAR